MLDSSSIRFLRTESISVYGSNLANKYWVCFRSVLFWSESTLSAFAIGLLGIMFDLINLGIVASAQPLEPSRAATMLSSPN